MRVPPHSPSPAPAPCFSPMSSPNQAVSLPTTADLNELSVIIQKTAREQGLSARTAARYEEWIFLFLAWCLKVPPYQFQGRRASAFWLALLQRQVSRTKVCQALDALDFFFGQLPDPASVSFATLRSSSDDASFSPEAVTDVCHPLPDAPLPGGVDPRSVIPTQAEASEPATDGSPSTDHPEEPASSSDDGPPSFWSLPALQDETPTEALDLTPASEMSTTTSISLPRSVARRVKSAAARQGLSPTVFAIRALNAACEVAESEAASLSTISDSLQVYQTQLNLLHFRDWTPPQELDASLDTLASSDDAGLVSPEASQTDDELTPTPAVEVQA